MTGQTPDRQLGGAADASSEQTSPFAEYGNAALIDRFYETEGDAEVGRELSVRLLQHAGYTGDPSAEQLVGRSGTAVTDPQTGRTLSLADYVNFAADHHPQALESILDFLLTKPGTPDYETGRATTLAMISPTKAPGN